MWNNERRDIIVRKWIGEKKCWEQLSSSGIQCFAVVNQTLQATKGAITIFVQDELWDILFKQEKFNTQCI
jgi:hypothetical protein